VLEQVIEKVRKVALEETAKFGTPAIEHIELSNAVGQELAKKLGADKNIVLLGTLLMDIKLGECFAEGKLQEHVERSAAFTKALLKREKVSPEIINKVINCVEAHHKKISFSCIESEICANADCYRFLHPRGLVASIKLWSQRPVDIDEMIKQIEYKVEEKKAILTLDICKAELDPYYGMIKEIFKKAKK